MNEEFKEIFSCLREILKAHSPGLKVSADEPGYYCVDVPFSARFKKSFPIAWVKVGKSYVSYHFMPVYMFPKLRDGMSARLKARMQGKSCFHFKVADEALFQELKHLTRNGFVLAKELDAASAIE